MTNNYIIDEVKVSFPDNLEEIKKLFDCLLDENKNLISFINPEIFMQEKKSALLVLRKLGIGWACGFIIAALVSIAMLIKSKIKKQNMTEYIAFGPFIVLATAVIIYMPNDVFITMLSKILRIS